MAKNKKCILCHKEYAYCDHCHSKVLDEPYWKNAWDTENCMKIFGILSTYLNGKIDAIEAKKQLIKCDITDKDLYSPKMAKAVDEVMVAIIEEPKDEDVKEDVKEEKKEAKKEERIIAKRTMRKINK